MRQFEDVFISENDQAAIIQCMCGMGHHHGQIEVRISDGFEEGGEWWTDWTGYFQVRMRPYYGLWSRIKGAWRVLRGDWWCADFEMSAIQGHMFSEWLKRKSSEAWDRDQNKPASRDYFDHLRECAVTAKEVSK